MSELISDEYKKLNQELHASNKSFGAKGYKLAEHIHERFINAYGLRSVLDYGCGKGTLSEAVYRKFGVNICNYDPCNDTYSNHPDVTYDGVICSDVLEHIEPNLISNVLQDIHSLGTRVYYFNIAMCPSNKTLSDGRNAHLIIENKQWWLALLEKNGYDVLEVLEDETHSDNPKLIFLKIICEQI